MCISNGCGNSGDNFCRLHFSSHLVRDVSDRPSGRLLGGREIAANCAVHHPEIAEPLLPLSPLRLSE